MEHINIEIKEGNVAIHSDCSHDNFLKATSVMFTSVAQNSSNTIEELLEIVKEHALYIIEHGSLTQTELEGQTDEV